MSYLFVFVFFFFSILTINLIWRQSFIIAVIAMVIATFSTGIDSKSFQVHPLLSKILLLNSSTKKDLSDNYMCSSGRMKPRLKMMFHMVMASSTLCLQLEPCTLQCCWLVGILTILWGSKLYIEKNYLIWRTLGLPLISCLERDRIYSDLQTYTIIKLSDIQLGKSIATAGYN